MRSESIAVSEAVIMAGLPTVAAAMRKARIITPDINGSTAKEVDLYSLLYGGDLKRMHCCIRETICMCRQR